MQKIWSAAEIARIVSALSVRSTEAIARDLGMTAKKLRAAMWRRGVSLRHLRKPARSERAPSERALGGLLTRRSADAPAAIHGGEALARLPDRCCSWPIGDPAVEGFAFCGAQIEGHGSYCAAHRARAYMPAPPLNLPPVKPLFAPWGEASRLIRCVAPALRR